jgi:hypothetical protein
MARHRVPIDPVVGCDVLDGAEQGSGGVAQIVSGGPDGAVGTDDDVSFVVTGEGALRDRPRARRGGGGGR